MDKKYAVYLFTGEDEFRKGLSVNKAKTKLSLSSESPDYNIYYGKDAKAFDIIQSLTTSPILAKRRLIVLKEIEKLSEEDKEKLISYFKKPNPASIFIITTQKAPDANDKFIAIARQHAKCIDFPMLKPAEISSWIKQEFESRKKIVEPEALAYLKENAPGDLNTINNLIEQLCLYAGKREKINQEDARALVGELPENSTFKLVDEISLRKQKSALKILVSLMEAGKDAHEILGLIAWHMRRLGKVKILLKNGKACEEIAENLRISYYRTQKVIEQAKNFTLEEIRKAQALLIETDLSLKRSVSMPEVVLQTLIMRLSLSL